MEFKYDVAFSFLARDEGAAVAIADLLQERLRTFVYSKQQESIAGKDGEIAFNTVFSKEARFVVVLYRPEWGTTPWTRIEETAIRNRAFEVGFEFVKFVPLEDSPTVPQWLPKAQLWIGFKRWGIQGTANVIEARATELGAEVVQEDAVSRATRLERSLQLKQERSAFLGSYSGVTASTAEFEKLQNEIRRLTSAIAEVTTTIGLTVKAESNPIVLVGFALGMSIEWKRYYANTLQDAFLEVSIWKGHPPMAGMYQFNIPECLSVKRFEFDLSALREVCWICGNFQSISTSELAEYCVKAYLDCVHKG